MAATGFDRHVDIPPSTPIPGGVLQLVVLAGRSERDEIVIIITIIIINIIIMIVITIMIMTNATAILAQAILTQVREGWAKVAKLPHNVSNLYQPHRGTSRVSVFLATLWLIYYLFCIILPFTALYTLHKLQHLC